MLVESTVSQPLSPFTVIIPFFNAEKTIQKSLKSVFAQSCPPAEIILIDDCSQDASHALVQEYISQFKSTTRVEILKNEKNSGPGVSRNKGIQAATQNYITFLDADDEWHPHRMKEIIKIFERDPEAFLVAHRYSFKKANSLENARPPQVIGKYALLFKNQFSTPAVAMKAQPRYLFPEKTYAEDFALWLNILFDQRKAVKLPQTLSWQQDSFSHAGLSKNLVKMEKGELDTYWRLFKKGSISIPTFVVVATFSIMKFFKRLVLRF